ncbi:unnamed protein product [Cunninghamella echinulata]
MPYNTRSRQHSEAHKSEEENEYPVKKERKLSSKDVKSNSPNHGKRSRSSSRERRASTGSTGSSSGQKSKSTSRGQRSKSSNGGRRSRSKSPSRGRRSRSSSREHTTEANYHPVKKEEEGAATKEKSGSGSDKGNEGINLEYEESPNEVQRLFMLLIPHHEKSSIHKEKRKSSLIIIGSKKLPLIKSHEKHWGSVVGASNDFNELLKDFKKHTYSTKTRGERTIEAVRILGIGAYSISHHQQKRNGYLSYILTDPDPPAQVQEDFNLEHEGTFAISVKNPKSNSGTNNGGDSGGHDNTRRFNKDPNFPNWLQKELRDLNFLPITETTLFLNYPDCQILLVGTRDSIDVDELGKDAVQALNLTTGEIKQKPTTKVIGEDLKVNLSDYNIEPLKGRYP